MRILHVTPSYKPAYHYGGPTLSVSRLAEAQAAVGTSVSVFTTTANGNAELEVPVGVQVQDNGVAIWYFSRWTGDHGHFSPALLLHLWREGKSYDVVNIHSWWNWVAFGAALVCKLRGYKTVVSPHGMLSPYTLASWRKRWFQQTVGKWLLNGTVFHATSNQEARELQKIWPGHRCFVAPNVVPLPDDLPLSKRPDHSDFHLLFISRVHHKKGLELLFEALCRLEGPWRLTIAGNGAQGYENQLRKRIKTLGLQNRIVWNGWVSQDQKWDLIADADLMVLPSYNENFANVVVEALATGTPVLLSDRVGLCNYVRSLDFGWVVERKVEALHQALKESMRDTGKRLRILRDAPRKIRDDFDPPTVARRYIDQYLAL